MKTNISPVAQLWIIMAVNAAGLAFIALCVALALALSSCVTVQERDRQGNPTGYEHKELAPDVKQTIQAGADAAQDATGIPVGGTVAALLGLVGIIGAEVTRRKIKKTREELEAEAARAEQAERTARLAVRSIEMAPPEARAFVKGNVANSPLSDVATRAYIETLKG